MNNQIVKATEDPSILPIELFSAHVSAGFPSPADDYSEGTLDLNQHIVKRPAATFFVRVTGESMLGAGMHNGDLLVVDRSIEPVDSSVVVAIVNGDLTVKRLHKQQGKVMLVSENQKYRPIEITAESDLQVWGVVTYVIHKV